jgi:hypothetical protein
MKLDIQIPELPGQWLDKFCIRHPKVRLYKCSGQSCHKVLQTVDVKGNLKEYNVCDMKGFCNGGVRCGKCDIEYLTERKIWTIKDRIAENERLKGVKK